MILDSMRKLREGPSQDEETKFEVLDPKAFLLKISSMIPKAWKLKKTIAKRRVHFEEGKEGSPELINELVLIKVLLDI